MHLIKTTDQAIEILKRGGVGVMPTDTVYGIVACANNPAAVTRLYALKKREHKPGTVIAANMDQLVELGIKRRYLTAVEQWWPNPLSVIIPTGSVLEYLHQGLDSLAIRIPKDDGIRQVLEQTGPLVTSSANEPGKPTANNIHEAEDYFGKSVDFYVDGGDMAGRQPSTVVRIVDDAIEVLRPGAVDISETGRINTANQREADCNFCRLNSKIEPDVIADEGEAYAIRSFNQPENFLIIPRNHVQALDALPDDWWQHCKAVLRQLPIEADYNLSINIGPAAGQNMAHLHFWIVPRLAGKPSSGIGLAKLITEFDTRLS